MLNNILREPIKQYFKITCYKMLSAFFVKERKYFKRQWNLLFLTKNNKNTKFVNLK